MAKYTEHLRLVKPEGNEYYNVEQFNQNAELIDKKIGEMDNSLSTIKEGATRAKAGIVQLGTEEGKALEGMMLARLAGAYGYGGDIQDEGVKNPNYIYYDRNTRKMYKCLNQNSDVSANVANFIPLDNNSLLEKLENLFTTKEEKTKLSLAQINNVNLNTITEPGFYTSSGWSNNIINLPAELNHNEGRAFYLLVFALENGAYCQQILYSFKGLIFYRAITGANSAFTQWKKLT
uniref:Putative tail fiber protein n=1 Tax=Phage sp. ctnfz20 TaxID=2825798 RepID=A0A8S5P616_9VIRU|nr:MAG TPA: putative tail fiber protein [Phage sp. ctnfz20]